MNWIRSWMVSWWEWLFPRSVLRCHQCRVAPEMLFGTIPKGRLERADMCYMCMTHQKECIYCEEPPEAVSFDSLSQSFVLLCGTHSHWEAQHGKSNVLVRIGKAAYPFEDND